MITISTQKHFEHPTVRVPTDIYIILDISPNSVERCFEQYKATILGLLKGLGDEDRVHFLTNKPEDTGLVWMRDIDKVIVEIVKAKRVNETEEIANTVVRCVQITEPGRKAVIFVFSHWFQKEKFKKFKDQSVKVFNKENVSLYILDTILYSVGIKGFYGFHRNKWSEYGINEYRDPLECMREGTQIRVGSAPICLYLLPRNTQYKPKFTFHHEKIKIRE